MIKNWLPRENGWLMNDKEFSKWCELSFRKLKRSYLNANCRPNVANEKISCKNFAKKATTLTFCRSFLFGVGR